MTDPRLRFRMWVDAELVDETFIDARRSDRDQLVDAMQHRHMVLAMQAHEDGHQWFVEVYDPAEPQAGMRFGTDDVGIVDPGST